MGMDKPTWENAAKKAPTERIEATRKQAIETVAQNFKVSYEDLNTFAAEENDKDVRLSGIVNGSKVSVVMDRKGALKGEMNGAAIEGEEARPIYDFLSRAIDERDAVREEVNPLALNQTFRTINVQHYHDQQPDEKTKAHRQHLEKRTAGSELTWGEVHQLRDRLITEIAPKVADRFREYFPHGDSQKYLDLANDNLVWSTVDFRILDLAEDENLTEEGLESLAKQLLLERLKQTVTYIESTFEKDERQNLLSRRKEAA